MNRRIGWLVLTVLCVSVISAVQAVPIVAWDYKYDAGIMPGVANCITDNAGTGVAKWIGSGAQATPTSKVYLGSGADAGTLFIDDLNGGGGNNYIRWDGYDGGPLTVYTRMAVLQDTANNIAPIMIDDGVSRRELFIYDDHVFGSTTVSVDMTVMRDIWISVPGDGPATIWVENPADPAGWSELGSYNRGATYGTYMNFGDIFSSTDSKQQWDFIYWKQGQAIALPEPASMVLLAVGGLVLRRRK